MASRVTQNGGIKELTINLGSIDKSEVKVGWFESAVYPNGEKVSFVASVQEFGDTSHNIPPRSFFRTSIREKQTEWKDKISKIAKAILDKRITVGQALEQFSFVIEGDIKEKIIQIQSPKLKESTIKARLRKMKDGKTVGNLNKPLVETAHMLNTITHVIVKK